MASYRDVVRDGRRYTADEYLELHHQLANDVRRELAANRSDSMRQTQGPRTQPRWQYGRSHVTDLQRQHKDRPEGHHREPDLHQVEETLPRRVNRGQRRLNPHPAQLNPYEIALGESLPSNLHHNWAGLLVHTHKVLLHGAIDSSTLH